MSQYESSRWERAQRDSGSIRPDPTTSNAMPDGSPRSLPDPEPPRLYEQIEAAHPDWTEGQIVAYVQDLTRGYGQRSEGHAALVDRINARLRRRPDLWDEFHAMSNRDRINAYEALVQHELSAEMERATAAETTVHPSSAMEYRAAQSRSDTAQMTDKEYREYLKDLADDHRNEQSQEYQRERD